KGCGTAPARHTPASLSATGKTPASVPISSIQVHTSLNSERTMKKNFPPLGKKKGAGSGVILYPAQLEDRSEANASPISFQKDFGATGCTVSEDAALFTIQN